MIVSNSPAVIDARCYAEASHRNEQLPFFVSEHTSPPRYNGIATAEITICSVLLTVERNRED